MSASTKRPLPHFGRAVPALYVTALLASGPLASDLRAEHERPNILLITADNLGYGDLGCYGNAVMKTPRLDRLAREGVRATDFYTASPTCTVSRASLLTGRYPQRHGLTIQLPGIDGNYGVGLNQSEILLPQLLTPQGYRTACFGKWNIGFAAGSRPTERGFDEFFGHASGNIDYYTHIYNGRLDMHRGTEPIQVEGYSTDLFADAACEFMRRHADAPFFIYLPFNAPHFPNPKNKQPHQPSIWQAPQRAFEAYGYDPDTTDERERYRAVVTALDEAIGRVLDELTALHVEDRTLVIFYSDNGAFMLKGRGFEVASNAPLREGGVTLWEGGIRVPCLIRWPCQLPVGTVCDEPFFSCDLFAMIARVAGATLPDDCIIDGRDPTAALAGTAASPHEALYFQFRSYSAVRAGPYKLLKTAPDKPWMLFDLHEDLGETTDIADRHDEIASRLAAQFDAWHVNFAKRN
ncbi:MAG: sulfatase-like hydrolase/transferase [Planctomycetes bacterium]|nr:sulfatase-like hydrolase/transferase [Planctomycetota bacterium]